MSAEVDPAGLRRPPPLQVVVAWHPDDCKGAQLADALFASLRADPRQAAAERLWIPVVFRSSRPGGPAPGPVDWAAAERTVVVVAAGDALLAEEAWRRWTREARRAVDEGRGGGTDVRRLMIGIALSDAAVGATDVFGNDLALLRAHLQPPGRQMTAAHTAVLAGVARLFDGGAPATVFISHAKSDGAEHASGLEQALASVKLRRFLDAHDIIEGDHIDTVIRRALETRPDMAPRRSVAVVAIVTDTYATREWCRIEALRPKRAGLPLVVLDAVQEVEARSLPYLGNVPVVRLGPDAPAAYDEVIANVLREIVRARHFPEYLRVRFGVREDDETILCLSNPPELLTILPTSSHGTPKRVIYPDPPVCAEEREVLVAALGPDTELCTPTMLRILHA